MGELLLVSSGTYRSSLKCVGKGRAGSVRPWLVKSFILAHYYLVVSEVADTLVYKFGRLDPSITRTKVLCTTGR